jgi:hypothetical protein
VGKSKLDGKRTEVNRRRFTVEFPTTVVVFAWSFSYSIEGEKQQPLRTSGHGFEGLNGYFVVKEETWARAGTGSAGAESAETEGKSKG